MSIHPPHLFPSLTSCSLPASPFPSLTTCSPSSPHAPLPHLMLPSFTTCSPPSPPAPLPHHLLPSLTSCSTRYSAQGSLAVTQSPPPLGFWLHMSAASFPSRTRLVSCHSPGNLQHTVPAPFSPACGPLPHHRCYCHCQPEG